MIKIWNEPDLTFVGATSFYSLSAYSAIGQAQFGNISREAADLVEFAGRLCYMSFGKGRKSQKEYIDNLLAQGHGSVLEHVSASILMQGISRSVSHEIVRHRAGFAYSQLSQRYVDESEVGFCRHPELDVGTPAYKLWAEGCESALNRYREMTAALPDFGGSVTEARKRKRQIAREVLPNSTETKIVMTGNVRAWRHFIETRASSSADVAIRRVALGVWQLLKAWQPLLFDDYVLVGDCLTTNFRKV